ncbi:hypothetical protein [Mycobacteroides abscessus]|uniref:hypothetical protein n=1 Tax=Mycobacteroides abscessus TaxID=36809 RepID=UPI000C26C036|nr:hypothetical protein [Mycobacteroides abscessus]
MTENEPDSHEPADGGQPDAAPASIEEVSHRLARITGELDERKTAAEQSQDKLIDAERQAQVEIDELTRKALIEIRDVKRRLDADIGEAQIRLNERVEAAGRQRDAATESYADAIDTVVASGLFTRQLLKGMGYTASRKKATIKPVVSKITAKDVED